MREVVLDASVVMKWFAREDEPGTREARDVRESYRRGDVLVNIPELLFLEILNVAGRRWAWDEDALLELATALDELDFDVIDPDLASVATWTARGLTAYDAAYVSLAESRGIDLISDDARILGIASSVARPLIAQ